MLFRSIPQNHFISSAEPVLIVETVAKLPDDPVAERKSVSAENGIKLNVQRDYLTVIHKISNLPAEAAGRRHARNYQVNDARLPGKIISKSRPLLV